MRLGPSGACLHDVWDRATQYADCARRSPRKSRSDAGSIPAGSTTVKAADEMFSRQRPFSSPASTCGMAVAADAVLLQTESKLILCADAHNPQGAIDLSSWRTCGASSSFSAK